MSLRTSVLPSLFLAEAAEMLTCGSKTRWEKQACCIFSDGSARTQAALARVAALWDRLAPATLEHANGCVIYCSSEVSQVVHPPQPLRKEICYFGPSFDMEPLNNALDTLHRLTYGLVVIDGEGAVLGQVRASPSGSFLMGCASVTKVGQFSANIASRTRRGGQSALRYSRLRDAAETAFLRKVVEYTKGAFDGVRGLILAGKADMKRKFLLELPPSLRSRVAKVVDLSCDASMEGLNRAACSVAEVMESSQLMEVEQALSHFFQTISQEASESSSLVCYGLEQTEVALELGAVQQVFLVRSQFRQPRWSKLAEARGAQVTEVLPNTALGHRFCEGFGVGGLLRWPVDVELLQDLSSLASPCMCPGKGSDQSGLARTLLEVASVPSGVHSDTDDDTSTAPSMSSNMFLQWLTIALSSSMKDAIAAESLVICADLVLADCSLPPEERIESAVEILRAEGVGEDLLDEIVVHAWDELFP